MGGAYGDRPNVPNVALIITDGESDMPALTAQQAEAARAEGIHMIAVGIGQTGSSAGQAELNSIATDPNEDNVFNIEDVGELYEIKQQLLELFSECQRK
ncbi:MATN2-like protein [Mya arenaria]|uniref:MATN2-like protein n=1 Tax=Mya arenaria TaxID=6604 RepID=A0ABY7FW25_MYAAR|nr:MATN2-like protein [Mya arenaria]